MDPFAALDHYADRIRNAQTVLEGPPDDPMQMVTWMRSRFSLSIAQLAKMLGKSVATVGRWSREGPNEAALSHMHLLARRLMAIEAQIETPGDAG